jgi:anti-sigma factor RsiW
MRCQDVERLMIETTEEERSSEQRPALESHLETCPACSAFRDFRNTLRSALENTTAPDLDADLAERVRLRCHAGLAQESSRKQAGVPWSIWAAFGVLTVITLGFFIPQITEFFATREFTAEIGLLLFIILQNAVMLFFAPIIMRRQGAGHNGWRECR